MVVDRMTNLVQQLREVSRAVWKLLQHRPYLAWWPALVVARIVHPPKRDPEWWQ